jgi:hypothetical protein
MPITYFFLHPKHLSSQIFNSLGLAVTMDVRLYTSRIKRANSYPTVSKMLLLKDHV